MSAADSYLTFGNFTFIDFTRTLWFDGQQVPLRPREAELLAILATRRPATVRRDELIERLWGTDGTDAALNQTIYRLRKRLARFDTTEHIRTHPDVGFQLVGGASAGLSDTAQLFRRPAFVHFQVASRLAADRSQVGTLRAIQILEKALESDRQFVEARVLLAKAYTTAGIRLFYDPLEAYWRAREHLSETLALDPKNASAFAALSVLLIFFNADRDHCRQAAQSSLLLAPHAPEAHNAMVWERIAAGDFNEALTRVDRALRLNPDSAHFTFLAGLSLYMDGRHDNAIDLLTNALVLDPTYVPARFYRACAECMRGDWGMALHDLSMIDGSDHRTRVAAVQGIVYARSGERERARRHAQKLLSADIPADVSVLAVYLALGETAHAERALQRALASREPGLFLVSVDPLYASAQQAFPSLIAHVRAGRRRQCDRCGNALPGSRRTTLIDLDLCSPCRDSHLRQLRGTSQDSKAIS